MRECMHACTHPYTHARVHAYMIYTWWCRQERPQRKTLNEVHLSSLILLSILKLSYVPPPKNAHNYIYAIPAEVAEKDGKSPTKKGAKASAGVGPAELVLDDVEVMIYVSYIHMFMYILIYMLSVYVYLHEVSSGGLRRSLVISRYIRVYVCVCV